MQRQHEARMKAFREPPPPAKEWRGGMDIFVGGGGDDLPIHPGFSLGVMHDVFRDYTKDTGRPTTYVANGRVDQIVDAIREGNRTLGPVNVIGHSYGGPDAYDAVAQARKLGLRVDNLATLDPVTGFYAKPAGPNGAGHWINVQATTARPNFSDAVTNLGVLSQKPSSLPVADADRSVSIEANHEDVGRMMRLGGVRKMLDDSRRLPELHDDLPMPAWMERRSSDAAGAR
jgi:pimeloyl-ACP methyl ester carboxylesterase